MLPLPERHHPAHSHPHAASLFHELLRATRRLGPGKLLTFQHCKLEMLYFCRHRLTLSMVNIIPRSMTIGWSQNVSSPMPHKVEPVTHKLHCLVATLRDYSTARYQDTSAHHALRFLKPRRNPHRPYLSIELDVLQNTLGGSQGNAIKRKALERSRGESLDISVTFRTSDPEMS